MGLERRQVYTEAAGVNCREGEGGAELTACLRTLSVFLTTLQNYYSACSLRATFPRDSSQGQFLRDSPLNFQEAEGRSLCTQ